MFTGARVSSTEKKNISLKSLQ
uniref:Uncharacterized protein n=1 Tax=Anguilla anguilla TaxID=7936 RepID=A0A0E9VMU6_ANGAN